MSSACLFTAGKTVLQSIVPLEEALNTPASVTAPVPSPASNEETYVIVLLEAEVRSSYSREPRTDTKSVCPADAAVVPEPNAI